VTFQEARFGLCMMPLWLREPGGVRDADVVMPLVYIEVERALPDHERASDDMVFRALWRRGLLPTQTPGISTSAPVLTSA
jgi:hypothetical protein